MIIFAVQVNYQLGVNKDCRHQLERDLANKDHGINIDHTVHNMKNTSGGINLHGGIERVDNHVSIPDSWVDYSHRNIQVLIRMELDYRNIQISYLRLLKQPGQQPSASCRRYSQQNTN